MRTSNYVDNTNLEERTSTWLKEIRSNVAPRPGFSIVKGKCALLIVDMLRYFAHPKGRCYLPASFAIIDPISALAEAWRRFKMPIIYTRHCHSGPGDLGMLGKFFSDYIEEDEADSKIISSLEPLPGDLVLKKNTYDAFLGTNLEKTLREADIHQVLVTGVLTHMCCETTARSAFCRGFEVFVPVDAVASSDEVRHRGSLLSMADSVAIMMSTNEVIECLQAKA